MGHCIRITLAFTAKDLPLKEERKKRIPIPRPKIDHQKTARK
jgi:hypothetical protein